MKQVLMIFFAVATAAVALAYQPVSSDPNVVPNVWNYNYNQAMAKAAELNLPVMLAFVNQGNCGYCATWDKQTQSSGDGAWGSFLAANPMILIWVDQSKQSYYVNPTWGALIAGRGWARITAYPEFVILRPGGGLVDEFVGRGSLAKNPTFYDRVRTAINGIPSTPTPPRPTPTPTPTASFPASAVGKYSGFLDQADSGKVRGVLTMTASAAGSLSARIDEAGAVYAFSKTGVKGNGTGGFTASMISSGKVLEIAVDSNGILTGTFSTGSRVFARRANLANSRSFSGYYTSVLDTPAVTPYSDQFDNRPKGAGYLTFTVSTRGVAKYGGLLADGSKVSGSASVTSYSGAELAALGYGSSMSADRNYACFPVYNALYSKRGLVAGLVWIDGGYLSTTAADNQVLLTGSNWTYPGKTTAPGDGFTATFDKAAFTLIGAYYGGGQNLAASYAGADLYVTEEGDGAPVVASGMSLTVAAGNAYGETLKAAASTGLFSGTFKQTSTGGRSVRVKYAGALVPAISAAGGYYLVSEQIAGVQVSRSKKVDIR